MAHLPGQKKDRRQTPIRPNQEQTPNQTPEKPSESLGSGSSAPPSSSSSKAADIAKKKLAEKKNGRGRPLGSTKKPAAEEQALPVVKEEKAAVNKKFTISPRFAGVIYQHFANGLARSFKAELITADEIKEFEQQYEEWIELEEFNPNPLVMARIGMITAVAMPIVIRHPAFEKLLFKFAGFDAEQDHAGSRPEGPRKDNVDQGTVEGKETDDRGGSPP